MRIDVRKILFFGWGKAQEEFFSRAQDFGIIHFIDPKEQGRKELPESIQQLIHAIRLLRSLPVTEQEEEVDFSLADKLTQEILAVKDHLDKQKESERLLRLEEQRVQVFAEFSPEDIEYIRKNAHRHMQFFCGKRNIADEIEIPKELFYVGSDHGLDYFFSVSKEPIHHEKLTEMKIEEPLSAVQAKLKRLSLEIQESEEQLKAFAKYNTFLHTALGIKMDGHHLDEANSYSVEPVDGSLFAVEGWVPENKLDQLKALAEGLDVDYSEIAVEEGDVSPTFLENHGLSKMGEDLVHVYDTPSITDKDPSLWVLVFFALFFAIIIGDAGYGLVFFATALYLQWKIKKPSKLGKRVLNLFTVLCGACIAWGLATTSFFGMEIPPNNRMQEFSVVKYLGKKKVAYHMDANDATYKGWVEKYPDLMQKTSAQEVLEYASVSKKEISYPIFTEIKESVLLELALLIGCIHVIISLIRNLYRSKVAIGWIIAIIGGYFYFAYYLNATSLFTYVFGADKVIGEMDAYVLLLGGLGLALLLSVFYNGLSGLLEVMTSIQIFSDVLSYLRLYALGLAGGIVASTVNGMAGSVHAVFGILIFLIGHGMNMLLAIMGGVIHGLRLNFLEWYHYSFEGGGKIFTPLQKLFTNEK